MSDKSSAMNSGERRRNPELRALIDEMLDRVRDIQRNSSAWSPEERARAEEQLEQIMMRIRREATSLSESDTPGGRGGKEG